MTESITGLAKYGKYLAILLQKRIVVTHNNGGPPNTWPQQAFADVGTDDEFVRQLAVDFVELLGATTIYGSRRDEVEGAIMELLVDGLLPAFSHLRDLKSPRSNGIGMVRRTQQFEDFTSALWRAYKTLTPRVTKLLGFDIGFAFQGDSAFEKGAAKFNRDHPEHTVVPDYLRTQRGAWQQRFADFRNHCIEHRNIGRENFSDFYDADAATELFAVVSQVIGELLLMFMAANLGPHMAIARIPLEARDPKNPRCFQFVWRNRNDRDHEGRGGQNL